jgi:predicted nucleotidyltransferase
MPKELLTPEFREIIQLITERNIHFVIIGGIAMRLHGSAHITQDVDFSYARDKENLQALSKALREKNARLRGVPEDLPFVLDEYTFRNTQNLTLITDLGEIDLLAVPDGIDSFEGLLERSVAMDLGEGLIVQVASIDDLIAMKRAANRPKDQSHLYELLALKKLLAEDNLRNLREIK